MPDAKSGSARSDLIDRQPEYIPGTMDYRPIDCLIHDQYLAWATMRTELSVKFSDLEGPLQVVTGVIDDVYTASDRTEWMLIGVMRIRLDRIHHIAPVTGTEQVAG